MQPQLQWQQPKTSCDACSLPRNRNALSHYRSRPCFTSCSLQMTQISYMQAQPSFPGMASTDKTFPPWYNMRVLLCMCQYSIFCRPGPIFTLGEPFCKGNVSTGWDCAQLTPSHPSRHDWGSANRCASITSTGWDCDLSLIFCFPLHKISSM